MAALERFMRDTAPPLARQIVPPDPWQRTALLEGVGGEQLDEVSPWGGAHPWS